MLSLSMWWYDNEWGRETAVGWYDQTSWDGERHASLQQVTQCHRLSERQDRYRGEIRKYGTRARARKRISAITRLPLEPAFPFFCIQALPLFSAAGHIWAILSLPKFDPWFLWKSITEEPIWAKYLFSFTHSKPALLTTPTTNLLSLLGWFSQ